MPNRELTHLINESVRVEQTGYSDWSTQQTITIATDPTIPSPPTISVVAATESLVITITAPTTNTDGTPIVDIKEYNIYYDATNNIDVTDSGTYAGVYTIAATKKTHPTSVLLYFKVVCVDKWGNESAGSNEDSATPNPAITLPEDDGLWMHRIGVDSVWTENTPASGITWSGVVLYWKGTAYTITNGSTINKYLWWDYSLSTTTFQETDTLPVLTYEDVLVAFNGSGTLHLVIYAPMVIADYVRAGTLQSTNWGAATGSELDLDSGTLKLGGSSAPSFSVDTDGLITSNAGSIAGFTISSTDGLYSGADATRVQMKPGAGFWAGATTQGSAPFGVTAAGVLTATSATITGAITATSGTIGGFTCDSTDGLYSGSEATRVQMKAGVGIWCGDDTFGDAPFRASPAGAVTCTNITVTGGVIGGFTPDAIEGIYVGSGVTRVQMKPGVGIWCGATAIGDAPFSVTNAGVLDAVSGTIGGFTLSATTLTGGNLTLDAGNTKITAGTGNDIVAIDAADTTYRLAIGHATYASAPFSVTKAGALKAESGTIGGCALGATSIGSTTFVSGPLGVGWQISNTGTAEFQNATIRGILRTTVFEKDTISAINGIVLITKADVLDSDMTAADTSTFTITGETTFVANEVIRIKDGIDDEWMLVTNAVSAPIYIVTRDLAGAYAANANPIWKTGTAVVSLGVGTGTKTGFIMLDSSSANSPYIDIYGRNSNTYTDYTLHGRFGWLQGITDADVGLSSTDVWGLYTDNAYIKGVIVANTGYIGGTSGWTIASGKMTASGIGIATATGDATYAFWAGDDTPANAEFSVSHAGALVSTSATISGAITATSGTIGGFTVNSTDGLYAGSGATRVQMKAGTGFWAGATAIGDAPFRATEAGIVTCSNITITGGVIGGWTPDSVEGFYVGTGVTRVQMKPGVGIWCGATAIGDAPFSVTEAGVLTATNATITGAITATSGVIGGFTVNSTDGLYAGAAATRVQMKPGAGFWAGATAQGSAPFRVTAAGVLTCTGASIRGTLNASDLTAGTLNFASISRSSLSIIASEIGSGQVTYGKIAADAVRTNELYIDGDIQFSPGASYQSAIGIEGLFRSDSKAATAPNITMTGAGLYLRSGTAAGLVVYINANDDIVLDAYGEIDFRGVDGGSCGGLTVAPKSIDVKFNGVLGRIAIYNP